LSIIFVITVSLLSELPRFYICLFIVVGDFSFVILYINLWHWSGLLCAEETSRSQTHAGNCVSGCTVEQAFFVIH